MNKIVHLFTKSDLRLGHRGLRLLAAKSKVDLNKLEVGEYALFANNSLTGMKVFAANNTVIYCKSPSHRPFDIRAMNALPEFIEGSSINYDAALLSVFRKKYAHLFPRELKK